MKMLGNTETELKKSFGYKKTRISFSEEQKESVFCANVYEWFLIITSNNVSLKLDLLKKVALFALMKTL